MCPQTNPTLDPSFSWIREALQSFDTRLPAFRGCPEDSTDAAVSVILREREDPDLLLIRRAEVRGDPWSGHMALPGGRRQPEDRSLRDTAIRETREETGIDLDLSGKALGRLRPLNPSTFRIPPISIYPFVFAVPPGTPARVASREVDQVYWTSLSSLTHPSARDVTRIQLGEETREFPCFDVEGEAVWGLTYRILTNLLQVLEGPPPPTRQ
jgi:8-oxo-dGTP pyrophosphatase MutT (NUDIX family)